MRSSTSTTPTSTTPTFTTTTFTTTTTATSTTPTSPNAATRSGSPHADDADSRSGSHSDAEGGSKPSLTTKIATTPSLPELVPLQAHAQLRNNTTALVNILLRAPNSEANQIGKRLGDKWKGCERDGVNAKSLQEIQDICLMLTGLAWGRDGIGLGNAEHQEFEKLVDAVFNASNRPEATQSDAGLASRGEKDDTESPSRKRAKRKVRSGEAPGSEGAEKKKSKINDIEITSPKLMSPYPPRPATAAHATTGNSHTTTTTTASPGLGAGSSHSASTDSPPLSPRHGFGIASSVSPAKSTGDSASLPGRIAKNLSTFATQFETLLGFGHAIDRSNWSAIQQAQEIVKSLLEPAGQPTSQLGRANELDKLSRAITSLNKALQSVQDDAAEVKHKDFDKVAFQNHARRMAKGLESIRTKVSELQSSTDQSMSPRSASGASPADAVSRVRSPSGGAKAHPSLYTFGRKAGKSIFQSGNADSPVSPQGNSPHSPRAARRSMLISVPVPNPKMNIETASTTATSASVASSSSPRTAATTLVMPLVTPSAPLSPPTSPRASLKPQPHPLRLRPASAQHADAGEHSIAKLKTALGKYSMRNLLEGFAVDDNSVVPIDTAGTASTTANTASSAVAAMPAPAVAGNAGGVPSDLRALLSGSSARNLLQRFRIEGDNVVANTEGQAPTASLPTQASGDLSDADIEELVMKVENGDADLIKSLIDSLEEALTEPVPEQSLEGTVILSSSSDEGESVQHDDEGTTGA